MAEIKYFGSDNNGSFVRPLSYTFPAGLNQVAAASGVTSVDYLVVAGGGGGGGGIYHGGGGGAGGFLTGSLVTTISTCVRGVNDYFSTCTHSQRLHRLLSV